MLTRPGKSLAVAVAALAAASAVGVGTPVSASAPPAGTTVAPGAAPTAGSPPSAESGGRPTVGPAPGTEPGATGAVTAEDFSDSLPGERPNIVVIMTDDMRDDDLKWMPNVQRLIGDRGVRFVNSFAPYPLCCPARSSFLTGQYTHNHGVWSNSEKYGFRAFDDSSTVATDLSAAGYQTAFLGKYLNGYGMAPAPDGSSADSNHYIPPGWTDWRGAITGIPGDSPEAGGAYSYFRTTLNVNGTLKGNHGYYQTRLLGAETEDMITGLSRSPRPFFLWASYVSPHEGYPIEKDDPEPVLRGSGRMAKVPTPARPADVVGLFDEQIHSSGAVAEPDLSDKPSFLRGRPALNTAEVDALTEVVRQRAEALYVVDQEVARTVDVLERTGELDDTVIVFTSDNGSLIGEHGTLQAKKLPYESSLRVPTLMAGPGIPAGELRHDPFLNTDFAPTFLDLAGARSGHVMDGVSMVDVARKGDRGWTRGVLTESGPRLLKGGVPPPLEIYPGGPSSLRFSQGVRTPRYLYVEHATRERELYDLRSDPLELHSIVDEPSSREVVLRLATVLDELRTCRGESCAVPLPRSLQKP